MSSITGVGAGLLFVALVARVGLDPVKAFVLGAHVTALDIRGNVDTGTDFLEHAQRHAGVADETLGFRLALRKPGAKHQLVVRLLRGNGRGKPKDGNCRDDRMASRLQFHILIIEAERPTVNK